MRPGILRRIVQGGGLSLIKLIAGLVKIKVLASLLGVEGIGLLALGLQFQTTAVGLVSMSLAVGVINLGRPLWMADDARGAGSVLGTALSLVAVNSAVFVTALAVYLYLVPGGLMPSLAAQGAWLVWPLALSAIVAAFASVLWESLAFLVDRFDVYVRSNAAAAIMDAALFVGGAWSFGLKGALCASLLSSLGLFVAFAVMSAQAPATRGVLGRASVTWSKVRPLLSYSVLMLTTTATGLVCIFLARARLTASAGEAANGYLQVVTALASYLQPFVMTGVWGHLHPAAAASGDTPDARRELHGTLVASMRLAAAGCTAVVVGAPILIRLVYTTAFMRSARLVPVYFIGELCFLFVSIVGAYLLAVGRKRAYFLGYSIYHAGLLAGVMLFVQPLGAWAYVLSHVSAAALVGLLALAHGVRHGLLDAATLTSVAACILPAAACCLLDYASVGVPLGGVTIRASWILAATIIVLVGRPYLPRLIPAWRS